MKLLISILIISTTVSLVSAQPPDTLFTQIYHNDLTDVACDMLGTPDGGFLMAGYTESDSVRVFVVRTDGQGQEAWRLVHIYQRGAAVNAVQKTGDGGYMLGGYTTATGSCGDAAVYMCRITSSGEVVWDNVLLSDASCCAMVPGDSGRYMLAGRRGAQMLLACADSMGQLLWYHTYSDPIGSLVAAAIARSTDGGYLLAGTRAIGFNARDWVLFKTSASGDLLWSQILDWGEAEMAYDLVALEDGGCMVVGTNVSEAPYPLDYQSAICLVRFTSYGDTLWSRRIQPCNYDEGHSIARTADGGYIIGGSTSDHLNHVWPYTFDALIMRTDSVGDTLWAQRTPGYQPGEINSLMQLPGGGFAGAGYFYNVRDTLETDMYLMRINPEAHDASSPRPSVMQPDCQLSAWPNPFNPTTTIRFNLPQAQRVTLSIYDLTGRLVEALADNSYPAGAHSVTFDGADWPSGIYFARLQGTGFAKTQKLVLLK